MELKKRLVVSFNKLNTFKVVVTIFFKLSFLRVFLKNIVDNWRFKEQKLVFLLLLIFSIFNQNIFCLLYVQKTLKLV